MEKIKFLGLFMFPLLNFFSNTEPFPDHVAVRTAVHCTNMNAYSAAQLIL